MKKIVFSIFLILLTLNVNFAQDNKTFIVLSGGGAKGIAHLPFLLNLQKNKVNIDGIVGVSAGSIAAALYSMYSTNPQKLKEISQKLYSLGIFEKISNKFDKEKKPTDFPHISLFFAELKLLKQSYLFPIDEIKNFLYSIFGDKKIEDLPIPIYIVALNINTGECTVFTKGEIVPRILASMAIPGIFPPQKINNNYYIDGGFIKNVPVSIAYKEGASTVYLSDISSKFKGINNIHNGLKVFFDLQDIVEDYLNYFERHLATYYIDYDLSPYKWYSFNRYEEIFKLAKKQLASGLTFNENIDVDKILWYISKQKISIK